MLKVRILINLQAGLGRPHRARRLRIKGQRVSECLETIEVVDPLF